VLRVVGPGTPRWLAQRLRTEPGVRAYGHVASVEPFLATATAMLVPIRAGGKTRIKILEALAHRVPVVSTSHGAFGLGLKHDLHLHIADTATDFVEGCISVGSDPERWTAAGLAASQRLGESTDLIPARELHD